MINPHLKMAGAAFANWWSRLGPYYAEAYQELWFGMGFMAYVYYRLSYGGKKAVKSRVFARSCGWMITMLHSLILGGVIPLLHSQDIKHSAKPELHDVAVAPSMCKSLPEELHLH